MFNNIDRKETAPANNLIIILDKINLPPQSLIYDLGCGDGRFLFLAEQKKLEAVGYELALYPYLKAIINKFFKSSRVVIKNKDFFKQDLSNADAIFIFLTASVMQKIGDKLKTNLKPNTLVVSYGFAIPGWPIKKILDTKPSKTYIY
jgi:SAM-dependent methyltransferase